MPRLIWTPGALADVQRIHRFLAAQSADAASKAVAAIRHGVKILGQHPGVGRPAPDMAPEFREWPIAFGASGYLVRYHFDGEAVAILTLRHQREAGFPQAKVADSDPEDQR